MMGTGTAQEIERGGEGFKASAPLYEFLPLQFSYKRRFSASMYLITY
jgi:hypothetical protein